MTYYGSSSVNYIWKFKQGLGFGYLKGAFILKIYEHRIFRWPSAGSIQACLLYVPKQLKISQAKFFLSQREFESKMPV